MTDDDLVAEYTRAEERPPGIALEVRVIHWDGPHAARSEWIPAVMLPPGASPTAIREARHSLIRDKRWFRICRECHERNPIGHMNDSRICQGCAEGNHGVVY